MSIPKPIVVDFETEAIERRPAYPPTPVGASIKHPGKAARYWAWGHPSGLGNNTDLATARRVLKDVWRSGEPLLFHNGKFDVDVAQTHMACGPLSWDRTHDTLFLLFFDNPHALNLSLKPSAERVLGIKPEERDKLHEWIVEHVPEMRRKKKSKDWGRYICRAPGGLVGSYSNGDVVRTELLFKKLYPEVAKAKMLEAYEREQRLMPILLENEREGVNVNVPLLDSDVELYKAALEKADDWLRKRLKSPSLNIDSDREFADALERSGVVTKFVVTAKGHKSVAKQNLTPDMFEDWKVASVYGYRNRLTTCLSMFMLPWQAMAHTSGGRVFTNWNQVRQTHGDEKLAGARTGRLSSNPNFMNVVKSWKKALSEGYVHPKFLRVPELPILRKYFLPDDRGSWWGRRDFNQQELRILAHYEAGELLENYLRNPRLDLHQMLKDFIREICNLDLPREPVKILNFADIYGQGLGTLAERMHVDIATAQLLRKTKNKMLPGVPQLIRDIKSRAGQGLPIRTWGGRLYYCEEAKFSKKHQRHMSFEYKLINYLIQGSAADCTKEALIRYANHPKKDSRFLVTVHDEINISAKKGVFKEQMALLRQIMQEIPFDLPMLSDGEYGKSWGEMKAFSEPEYKPEKVMVTVA